MQRLRAALAWFGAVVVTAAAGSVIQTQFNLAMIQRLGAPIPWPVRLETTLHDLAGFAPTYALLVAAGFLVALPVSGLLARRWPRARIALHALAGFAAIAGALLVMNALLPATMIGAARFASGIGALAAAGALGGWLFALWIRPHGPR
ncbi:hypothetical protein [Thioalkalivibrio nitratireducens]|uniref:hypothetical protein n=1 Tax=Thioalkalivibrio nitratireducens TaxID=186931 RepID=UPI0002DA7BFD|nr:hypothetical protein [Thioalkalivibrio nitratireducens]